MSREERQRREAFRGQVRGELSRAAAEQWLDRAATGADPGPMPAAAPGWEAWHARDPEGFGEHVGALIADARARRDRRRAALEAEAEAAELEAEQRRARHAAAIAAVVLVLGAVVVVMVVRRRRRRQRAAMMPEVYRAPEAPSAPYLGLRLDSIGDL